MSQHMTEADLREIEEYLEDDTTGTDSRVEQWLRGLVEEVRRLRLAQDEPRKMHGDALLDGSGTRHGEHEVR